MEKQQLLRKLEAMFDSIEKEREWGTIEIEFREGAPHYVRKTLTEKVAPEKPRAQKTFR